jgi:bifunctional DNA-binding transcriptional regulator/antitoxin component of YhaV-PrlF toxin-antitoxin module
MVKFQVRANSSGQYYFPKEVRAELGNKLALICNTKTALVFSQDTPLNVVLQSVQIIVKDLQQRLQMQKEEHFSK